MPWAVEIAAEVDSTNRVLLDRAREGSPEGVVLVADHQTAGRGRLGRRWEAAPGDALLASVLLRPVLPLGRLHLVTVAAGLAAREACAQLGAEPPPGLKWPNDLVAGDRKLAGLLAESVVSAGRAEAVVVGMGLNLVTSERLPERAVALDELTGAPVDRQALLDAWLPAFERRYRAPGELAEEHRAACVTLGRDVRVERSGGDLVGRAVDVTDDGHLLVDDGAGTHEVAVGDVIHLRPA